MNEALNIFKNFKSEKKHKIEKLDISNIKDMQTIINDTKIYLENLRKGLKNG